MKYVCKLCVRSKSIENELSYFRTSLLVCQQEIWPIKTKSIDEPNSFKETKNNILNWYNNKYSDRKLVFNNDLLRCTISFNGYNFNIKGCYVDFILSFNTNNKIKKNKDIDIKSFIKIGLIKEEDDFYSVNDDFYHKHKTIKI